MIELAAVIAALVAYRTRLKDRGQLLKAMADNRIEHVVRLHPLAKMFQL